MRDPKRNVSKRPGLVHSGGIRVRAEVLSPIVMLVDSWEQNSSEPVWNIPVRPTAYRNPPIVNMLKIVPTTAINNIVPSWSKNNLFGIKYPASPMIGGSRKRKKMSGVSVVGLSSSGATKKKNNPMRRPNKTRTLDSGRNLLINVAL